MTRSELILRLCETHRHLYQTDLELVVDSFFDTIAKALAEGKRVELRGFGTFSVRHREARQGRNPRTGDTVQVQAKAVPFFKAGKQLRDRLNGTAQTIGAHEGGTANG